MCEFESGADLGNAINGWHGSVHIAIGGTMSSIMIASAAPIFWCWHAFVDHIYWNWQMCQLTCPDLVGCPLEIAKLKIKRAGLKLGCVTRLPRYCVPPAHVPVGYAPRPDEYLQGLRPHHRLSIITSTPSPRPKLCALTGKWLTKPRAMQSQAGSREIRTRRSRANPRCTSMEIARDRFLSVKLIRAIRSRFDIRRRTIRICCAVRS